MTTQKLTLAEWAKKRFASPPAERTLRLWVKAQRIIPAPIKIGRTYYVEQGARHVAEIAASPRGSLVDRLRSQA